VKEEVVGRSKSNEAAHWKTHKDIKI
jgi:hypothetical protein